MIRGPRFPVRAAALLLAAAAGPGRADGGLDPGATYTGFTAFFGGLGGAVLGASLGALSRPASDTSADSLKLWGSVGAATGVVLGAGIGRDAVAGPSTFLGAGPAGFARAPARELRRRAGAGDERPAPRPGSGLATQGTAGCIGSLAGEILGAAAGYAASRGAGWDDRRVYAGLALGALAGAAAGSLLPPLRFLSPPAPRVRDRREAPLAAVLPPAADRVTPEQERLLAERPGDLPPGGMLATPPSPSRLRSLTYALMGPEEMQLLPAPGPLTMAPRPFVAVAPVIPPDLVALVRSVTTLGLASGAVLGAGLGAAVATGDGQARSFAAVGAALGAFGGWYATDAFASRWQELDEGEAADLSGRLAEGHRVSVVLTGGLVGGLAGAAAGLAAANFTGDIGPQQIGGSALAGSLLGLALGSALTTR